MKLSNILWNMEQISRSLHLVPCGTPHSSPLPSSLLQQQAKQRNQTSKPSNVTTVWAQISANANAQVDELQKQKQKQKHIPGPPLAGVINNHMEVRDVVSFDDTEQTLNGVGPRETG